MLGQNEKLAVLLETILQMLNSKYSNLTKHINVNQHCTAAEINSHTVFTIYCLCTGWRTAMHCLHIAQRICVHQMSALAAQLESTAEVQSTYQSIRAPQLSDQQPEIQCNVTQSSDRQNFNISR